MSNDFPKLIGIHGRARAGKDTVATFLNATYKNHWIEALADPLKEAAAAAFGIDVEDFYQDGSKELANPYWGVSPRKIAQFMGTEMFRNCISDLLPDIQSFWITRLEGKLSNQIDDGNYGSGDTVVIPDVRFQDEYDWVISKGGIIIHLTRDAIPDTVGIPGHASEAPIDLHCKERTYSCANNSTIQNLYSKIANIIASSSY